MKTITFAEVPLNGNFTIELLGHERPMWCNKIDGARYIYIGENGAHFPPHSPQCDMPVKVEA